MVWKMILPSVWCLAVGWVSLRAATYQLEPVADARVIDISGSGFAQQNFEKDILSVYTANGNVQRTFIRFDFGGINLAPGERVSSATLSLTASTGFGGSSGRTSEVYRVTQAWTENGLTWNSRDTGVAWKTRGGDYAGRTGGPDVSPYSINAQQPQGGEVVSWDVTALVNEWVESISPNYGLLLRSTVGNGLTFTPRESTPTSARPRLVVVTSPGPPSLVAQLTDQGQIMISWRGANVGVLEESPKLSVAGWQGSARTLTVLGDRTQVTIPPSENGKFFRLRSP